MKALVIHVSEISALFNDMANKKDIYNKIRYRNRDVLGCVTTYVSPFTNAIRILSTQEMNELLKTMGLSTNATESEIQKSIQLYVNQIICDNDIDKAIKIISLKFLPGIFGKNFHDEVLTLCKMKHGLQMEESSIQEIEKRLQVVISERNTKTWKKKIYHPTYDLWIHGKVDGIDNKNRVVETKNRCSHLFFDIPSYEKVQLELYMWLTNTTECIHAEMFQSIQSIKMYTQNKTFLTYILANVRDFANSIVDTNGALT